MGREMRRKKEEEEKQKKKKKVKKNITCMLNYKICEKRAENFVACMAHCFL